MRAIVGKEMVEWKKGKQKKKEYLNQLKDQNI